MATLLKMKSRPGLKKPSLNILQTRQIITLASFISPQTDKDVCRESTMRGIIQLAKYKKSRLE